jgi:hypothetical protein
VRVLAGRFKSPVTAAVLTAVAVVVAPTAVPSAANAAAGSLPQVGYMFWAAERPSTRGVTTDPPNSCEGGVGAGATAFNVPVPMPALRQS